MADDIFITVFIVEAIVMSALSGLPYKRGFLAHKRGLLVIPYVIIIPTFLMEMFIFSGDLKNYYIGLFCVILIMHFLIRKNVHKGQ